MKYIVDVPDKAIDFMGGSDHFSIFVEPEYKVGDCKHYALRISKEDIEPYTEPDRNAIEDEVWSLAREIAYCMSLQECIYAGMLHDDDIYDSASGVLEKLTCQEAKTKYEAWKRKKEEIRVGDEVVYADDPNKEKAIVLRLYQPKQYKTLADILCEDGTVVKMIKVENLAWTGRHFDEIADLLKKMKEQ